MSHLFQDSGWHCSGCKVGLWFNSPDVSSCLSSTAPSPLSLPPPLPASLYCYLKVSWLARYVRRSSGLNLPVPLSPPGPSSPFLRVISSSMVISTRSAPSPPLPPTLSVFLTMVRCCCFGWAFATAWRTGWSSRLVSPPQPLPVSYFLSLRDSCFFFSEAAAFTLEGSAGGTGPCGGAGRGGRGENRGGESLQEERSVREIKREREGERKREREREKADWEGGREGGTKGGRGEMLEVRE